MDRGFDNILRINLIFILLFALGLVIGCASVDDDDDDDGLATVYIYNYDEDHEYRVELRLVADDSLVNSCSVEEYPDSQYEDTIDDIEADEYYLITFQDQGTVETSRSGTFHLEEDEVVCYFVEEDGDLKNC